MKSTRCSIVLGYDERVEIEPGVWENNLVEKKIKAEQEQIYQRRLDLALQEGNVITARFRIRSNLIKSDLKYVAWQGNQYKVNNIYDDVDRHYTIIEIGQMI